RSEHETNYHDNGSIITHFTHPQNVKYEKKIRESSNSSPNLFNFIAVNLKAYIFSSLGKTPLFFI
ncbi:hypothetical protein, partial [Bacillus sp. T33-2]|uniref:hypothetical protein n=1 Tax=Bacillus sp. T33-2 TaxID=2054168 RepID=UPI000CB4E27C